ncbi:MAG: UDP-N-acetylglucosamine 2-epimerase [Bacteroidales bacterium]|nr:UDP-N-acetylglucosamine 2-epimerase [Bacteroidales bacterium]
MTNICVVTATRAEYGLLKPLMKLLKQSKVLNLQVLVTGAHLSTEFGLTYKDIEKDGFTIDDKVEMLLSSDTAKGIVKSMGVGMIAYADAFDRLKPNALVILGDRYEMLAIASSASVFRIPIIHLHGGEITEGAYDDAFRHAITKLSYLHFTSTEQYRNRVIQLGENPKNVFNVGAIGLDNIHTLNLLSRNELEFELGFKFQKFNYQVTFHPETLGSMSSKDQFSILLDAIKEQEDSFFIFTKSNADTDGRIINTMIDEFANNYPDKAKAFASLGILRFLSLVKECDAMIGNSSSGIVEAPTLKVATINIGNRQKGRMQTNSVINCDVHKKQIKEAIMLSQDKVFKQKVAKVKNPYGNGGTANRIISILESTNWDDINNKSFYNIDISKFNS